MFTPIYLVLCGVILRPTNVVDDVATPVGHRPDERFLLLTTRLHFVELVVFRSTRPTDALKNTLHKRHSVGADFVITATRGNVFLVGVEIKHVTLEEQHSYSILFVRFRLISKSLAFPSCW